MLDSYGREVDYLRISITDKCNLRCRYCMPEDINHVPMNEILSFEEIVLIAEVAAGLGIKHIKITGGEPLVRKDAPGLIRMLKNVPGIEEVTLTTNGILLSDYMDDIINAGIDGINISLDTLNRDAYKLITGRDELGRVMNSIEKAQRSGVRLKLNAVSFDWEKLNIRADNGDYPAAVKNVDNIISLIELTRDSRMDVRFIELMPIGFGKDFPGISHKELYNMIKSRYERLDIDESRHGNGPAVYYRIPGYMGCVGFISAIHGVFCASCNRIRLTTKGYLKSCLCYDGVYNAKEIIRSEVPDQIKRDKLRMMLEDVIKQKPKAHSFLSDAGITEKQAMSEIGG